MDKLTNIQIDGDKLTFKIETEVDLSSYSKEVYIDEVWNLKNILEDSPIHNISFSENITVDSDNNVTVTNDDILELDWNMKYVTLRCFTEQEEIHFHGIYYNPSIVYMAEIRKLHTHCSTCLDDQTMQNIMLVVFKRQLLQHPITIAMLYNYMQISVDYLRYLLNQNVQLVLAVTMLFLLRKVIVSIQKTISVFIQRKSVTLLLYLVVFVTLVLIILAVQEIAVTVIVNYKINRYDTKM